jgi:polyhydroxyalkanoate synthesis repressor PhaR
MTTHVIGTPAITLMVKRYANRKLYNTEESKYITLKQLVEQVKLGRQVQVTDNISKEDITATTLLTAIVETEDGTTDAGVLTDILRAGGLTKYVAGVAGVAVVNRLAGV